MLSNKIFYTTVDFIIYFGEYTNRNIVFKLTHSTEWEIHHQKSGNNTLIVVSMCLTG